MIKKLLIGLALAVVAAVSHASEVSYAPQTISEGGVNVVVTPKDISASADTWDFQVALETHTHDLTDDLAGASALVADGKQYAATSWEGSAPGGHHRKGVLHFKAIAPRPQTVELHMRLAGDASPRVFKWALK